MYGNGYSMAIVLDHRSTATSLTGKQLVGLAHRPLEVKCVGALKETRNSVKIKRLCFALA